jgi:hypothetical protein
LKDEKTRKEAKKAKVLTLTNLHKEDEKGLALRTKKQQRRSKKFGEDADEAKLSKGASGEEDGDEEGSDEEGSDEEDSEEEEEQQNVFDDEATMNMFGGEVSVVVDANPVAGQFRTDEEIFGPKSGEGGDSDNDDAGSIQSYRSRASQQGRQQHQPSRFERAMKKVKATLGTKKKNKAKEMKGKARSLRKKVESKMLYEKALGRKVKKGR